MLQKKKKNTDKWREKKRPRNGVRELKIYSMRKD